MTAPSASPPSLLPAVAGAAPLSIHAADLDHRLYVLFAVVTHAGVGYALVSLAPVGRPATGALAAVLPDVDLLFAPGWAFPLVHRGVTHTPAAAALVTLAVAAAAAARGGRDAGAAAATAAGVGLCSHLLLDTLTRSGVMWLYPLSIAPFAVDLSVHAAEHGVLIWCFIVATLLVVRRRRRGESERSGDRV